MRDTIKDIIRLYRGIYMKVEQIYTIVNSLVEQATGEQTATVAVDGKTLVDAGKKILDSGDTNAILGQMVDLVGKMVFVDRKYSGRAPSVLMESWEYGSVVEKFRGELSEARVNDTWELTDGTSYDTNIFTKPKITVKVFNGLKTFEVPLSILDKQLKSSFNSASQLNQLLSMIYNEVEKTFTLAYDELIMTTINTMTARTVANACGGQIPTKDVLGAQTTASCVNLLKLYNDNFGTEVKAAEAIKTPDFNKFASSVLLQYVDRLATASTLFNVGKTVKFTPVDKLHFVMLSEFKRDFDAYLQSDVFHDNYTELPKAETVAYWQGSGERFAFNETSRIHILTESVAQAEGAGAGVVDVNIDGILAVMFDHDALGVQNSERRTTTNYNARGEFTNLYYKTEANYFNDLDENFVVFYVADAAA